VSEQAGATGRVTKPQNNPSTRCFTGRWRIETLLALWSALAFWLAARGGAAPARRPT